MGLHHKHTHGRVFRGLEAREQLEIRKRDSHGNSPVMHVPEGFDEKAVDEKDVATAVSVVYVTLPQTFSGDAVYVTMSGDPSAAAPATQAAATSAAAQAEHSAAQAGSQASSDLPATSLAVVSPTSASSNSALTTFATATAAAISSAAVSNSAPSVLVGAPIQATRSPSASATPSASSDSSSGLSGGARAGLAIGLILFIALAGGLVYVLWRKKKAQKSHEEIHDEKHESFVDAGARRFEASGGARDSVATEKVPASLRSTRTASTAPRLSLRPVTQFLPNLSENRKSSANALAGAAAVGGLAATKSSWERSPSNGAQNPFADASVMSEKDARPHSPPSNPFDENKSTESLPTGAAAAATAKHSPKSSWEGTEPPTPKSTKFGTAAAVPVAAAGAAAKDVSPPRGPNNVHRVQLDFKPSMDDELELKSGQLVRMLHEYDDGWALCIRMDRSQQGVCPRTCLSKVPVKPRPQGPPGSRPGPPPQGARRPSNPPAPIQPPQALNGPMFPRPLTPSQSNSQAVSPVSSNGDASSSGSSPAGIPSRKPVPGQAM